MSKDPAFLFYPGDWLGGTMLMTRHHKGAYMDLLMAQYNNGHMTLQEIKTVLGEKDEGLWETVLKSKFKQDGEGKFFNEKLENEKLKRSAYTESRRKNLQKERTHMAPHMGTHMENENVNENLDTSKPEEKPARKLFKKPTVEEIKAYCQERKNGIDAQAFWDHYETRGWVPKGYTTQMKDWKAAVRTWEGRRKETTYVSQDLRHDSGPISYLKKPIKNDTI